MNPQLHNMFACWLAVIIYIYCKYFEGVCFCMCLAMRVLNVCHSNRNLPNSTLYEWAWLVLMRGCG